MPPAPPRTGSVSAPKRSAEAAVSCARMGGEITAITQIHEMRIVRMSPPDQTILSELISDFELRSGSGRRGAADGGDARRMDEFFIASSGDSRQGQQRHRRRGLGDYSGEMMVMERAGGGAGDAASTRRAR